MCVLKFYAWLYNRLVFNVQDCILFYRNYSKQLKGQCDIMCPMVFNRICSLSYFTQGVFLRYSADIVPYSCRNMSNPPHMEYSSHFHSYYGFKDINTHNILFVQFYLNSCFIHS